MPPESAVGWRGVAARGRGLVFPLLIVASVLVIVVPLPAVMMDLLLACNVTVAVVILLTTIYVKRPLDFSVFPAVLLGTTLARLVLNVASTRLILSNGGTQGVSAAGGVIEAFGQFVAAGNIAIGLILFVILVAIQFLVITKGATRISEVAARFALDGMPGKQMAIDADLNAGLVTAEEAKARREEVGQQADFYGAMDGASKFVRGDSIASIVITLVNIVGGLYVGMVQNGMTITEAGTVFTTLTIGDGLVTQVPAFLISMAAGIIATRESGDSNLSKDVVEQTFAHPDALFLAAAFLVALSATGLPVAPMIALGLACVVTGFVLKNGQKEAAVRKDQETKQQEVQEAAKPEPKPEDRLLVDPLELELGYRLIRLADPSSGGDLLDRVTRIRHKVAQEIGLILPKVRIRDNIRIDERSYQIKIRDVPVAWGEAFVGGFLAIDTGATNGPVPGIETVEPAFGRKAYWIEEAQKERAEIAGYSVVEPSAVLATHLVEVVRDHSAELLTRQQVHALLDHLRDQSPKVVEELVPDLMRPAQVHQVLANLLRERVPIRDLESILETLGTYAGRTQDLTILTEYARHGLARAICRQYRDKNRVLHVVTLDAALEEVLAAGIEFGETGMIVKLSPQVSESVTRSIAEQVKKLVERGHPPVVLCNPQIRAGLRQITAAALPKLAVVSLNEVTRDTDAEALGHVSTEAPQAA